MRARRTRGFSSYAVSARWLAARYALPLLFATAAFTVTISQTHEQDIARLRNRVSEGMLPLWQALAAPGRAMADMSATMADWQNLHAQNQQLRADNEVLLQWQAEAQRLRAENERLEKLTNFVSPANARMVTARVVTDAGSTYQRSLLVLAGVEDGVEVGAVVLGKSGVIGRVTEVGAHAARVLLMNDVNARIPARLEQSGATTIVAGEGKAMPELMYLPRDITPTIGERVVTSGHGGIFPAGLPIGTVASVHGSTVKIDPLENAEALDIVRIVDYSVPTDIAPNR